MADSRLNLSTPSALRSVLAAALLCTGLAVGAYAATPAAAPAASAQPVNLQSASNTDLPGSPSRVRIDQGLGVHAIKQRDGLVVLDNAVLLKTYVYAYAKQPLDDTAILTPNTEMIDPPQPVHATAEEQRQIEAMVAFDRAHPRLRIDVEDIALDPYATASKDYPIDNRLFIHGAGYYFDNSPYHFTYDHPEAFRRLRCTDTGVMKIIDRHIADYAHFHMTIFATVLGASRHTLHLRVDEVQLKDDLGQVLIDQRAP